MKKSDKIAFGVLAGIGLGVFAYRLLNKSRIYEEDIVQDLDLRRYMGEWYEIARIPSLNKRHLSGVREDYRMNNDNRSFTVVTTAHNDRRSKPFSARGVITRPRGEIGGKLKASYFKPVTSAYNIFDVDNDYKYALVGTNNLNSLWVLSRDRSITPEIKLRFLRKATTMGFKTSRLIWCY